MNQRDRRGRVESRWLPCIGAVGASLLVALSVACSSSKPAEDTSQSACILKANGDTISYCKMYTPSLCDTKVSYVSAYKRGETCWGNGYRTCCEDGTWDAYFLSTADGSKVLSKGCTTCTSSSGGGSDSGTTDRCQRCLDSCGPGAVCDCTISCS